MQRVTEVRKRKGNIPQAQNKEQKLTEINIGNDILFLLSLSHPNIRRALPSFIVTRKRKDFQIRHLRTEYSYSFDVSLKFYTNLSTIYIKNASIVYLRTLESKRLELLAFDSVNRFDFSEDLKITVFNLVMKNIKVSANDFMSLLRILKPKSLELINVQLKENEDDSIRRILHKMLELDLINLRVDSSFINIDRFVCFIHEKRPNRFSFLSHSQVLSYSSIGRSISHLEVIGIENRHLRVLHDQLEEVDALIIRSDQNIASIPEIILKNAKYVILEGIVICSRLLKRFENLRSVILRECSFDHLCFYGFIDQFCSKLKVLCFKNTEIPLDCIAYMNKRLLDCTIQYNNNQFLHTLEDRFS